MGRWGMEFTCGHKPYMGIRCDECSPIKANIAYEKPTRQDFHGIPPCPTCSRIAEKLDREKLAKVIMEPMHNDRSPMDIADAIIKYLKEG
jgi:hypothetical protein